MSGKQSQSAAMQRCAEAERKERRAAHREAKKKFLKIPQLLRLAQKEFNKFIRLRDAGKPCICCPDKGPAEPAHAALNGHNVDAGHYRSVGAAAHLRFNEDNVHAQLVNCNRDKSGNSVEYRKGLLARIGAARVELLEDDNRVVKWSRDELIAIRKDYLNRWKVLKAAREQA